MDKVKAGQIAGRIVKEHIFRTGIARVDASAFRAGMPFVDGGIELQTGVGALPRTEQNFLPQVTRLDHSCRLAGCPLTQVPDIVICYRFHELIGHPDGIVRILALHVRMRIFRHQKTG